jgi:hypothetical protein
MPTVAPTGNGDQAAVENRNAGTVIKGGNAAADSPLQNTIAVSELADDQGTPLGSKVIASDGAGTQYTDKHGIQDAVGNAGTDGVTQLGYAADSTEWVVLGGNVTQTLAGAAYTDLRGAAAEIEGANVLRDSTYQVEASRVLGIVDVDIQAVPSSGYNSWVTKSAGPGGAGGTSQPMIKPSGAGDEQSVDKAANTSRAVPGELTYMFGGKLPNTDNYKAQDAAE